LKSAVRIAEIAGFSVPAGTRALVAHADNVGPEYPISMEKLANPGFFVVKDWQEGALIIEIEFQGAWTHPELIPGT
jgi:acetaldehyde dehydrogenase/alcohol dehydrogenase